ncbi:MAG TPA: hypothetical protein PKY66_04365 [Thermoflexales bacterium]|nr:hypothetical protein [Thermoflexales bacterium]HQX09624.1 hypothetical protein [Thermoflexales bacterium]
MKIASAQRSTLFTLGVLICLSCLPLLVAYRYPAFLNDDAYITLTYVKNLVNGNGFVFNHPPAVLGTTTPLFTLVVAGLALLLPGVEIATLAVFLSALSWLGTTWVFYLFRKQWALRNWEVCALSAVLISSGWVVFLGMEFHPFELLLVLSVSLFLSERYELSGLTGGALFLTRGEGALVFVLLLIVAIARDRTKKGRFDADSLRNPLKLTLGFGLPILAWAIYAQLTFGSFLPGTLAAKQAQALTGFWRTFPQRLTGEWLTSWGSGLSLQSLKVINIWWIVVIIGLLDSLVRKRKWLIFVGWIGLYIAGYSLLSVAAYGWYQLPILFVLNLFFGLGVVRIVELLIERVRPRGVAIGASLVLSLSLVIGLARPTLEAISTFKGDARGESYLALSQWFREHANPGESIAYIEIGYLGYFTQNRIIDLAGLTLPDLPPHIAKGDFAWGFWRYRPDYYVYRAEFDWALASVMSDPRFGQEYLPVAAVPGPKGVDLVIYHRTGN